MRTVTPQDDLPDGIEPAATPPVAADGGLEFTSIPRLLPPRPRLCEAGPCKNYHRFSIQMDAATPHTRKLPIVLPEGTPGAQPVPGGTVYTSPAGFHVQVSHYCYPTSGVEMILGDLPVTECNRWAPIGDHDEDGAAVARDRFRRTSAGRAFVSQVRDWEHARAAEVAADEEAERLIEASLKMHDNKETP